MSLGEYVLSIRSIPGKESGGDYFIACVGLWRGSLLERKQV